MQFQNDVILPEFKPKYQILINRSSFIDQKQGIKIMRKFAPFKKVKAAKKIGLKILDCSLSLYTNDISAVNTDKHIVDKEKVMEMDASQLQEKQ